MRLSFFLTILLCMPFIAGAQSTGADSLFLPLYPKGKMPNSRGLQLKDSIVNERIYQVGTPGMFVFLPPESKRNGCAVLICPGGGYERLAYIGSGFEIAEWLNELGVAAFVLQYRLPNSPDLVQRPVGPLQDAQRAMQLIRSSASAWKIDTGRIGALGASAGGHLAGMLGTCNSNVVSMDDLLNRFKYRPDFMILISPVIDLGDYAHKGSRNNLLGVALSEDLVHQYSLQHWVNKQTPPVFIADAFNDKAVPPMNSLLFYKALLEQNISTSFHVFPQGGHAIGINNNPGSTKLWTQLCAAWLKEMGFIY